MILSPRAIAMQGIGFPERLVALQGLVPLPEGGPAPSPALGAYGVASRNRRRPLKKRRPKHFDDDELLFLT